MNHSDVAKTAGPARSLCLFQSGANAYAVRLHAVAEVIEVERSVRLPHSPPNVLGMCVLRRDVVPVVEIGEPSSEHAPSRALGKNTVLLLKSTQGTWGVQVNSEGIAVTEETPEDAIETEPGRPRSTIQRGNTVYTLIDPESTWRRLRQSVEQWYTRYWGAEPAAGGKPGRPSHVSTPVNASAPAAHH